jgi:hypothetical protein
MMMRMMQMQTQAQSMMKSMMTKTTIPSYLQQQLQQQPGPDNDELPRHLKRLQMVAQFGWMVCGGLQDFNHCWGPCTKMGADDPPDFFRIRGLRIGVKEGTFAPWGASPW